MKNQKYLLSFLQLLEILRGKSGIIQFLWSAKITVSTFLGSSDENITAIIAPAPN